MYMQARYYDPVIGRFYSNDPVGTLGHLNQGNIQGFNRYAYANNNPYAYTDPDGNNAIRILATAVKDPSRTGRQIVRGARAIGEALGLISLAENAGNGSDEGMVNGDVPAGVADSDATKPTGRRGNPMDVEPGTNEPTEIGEREYSGHAQDQMQGRGIPPSAVEEAIGNGDSAPGNRPNTTTHTDSQNGVQAVTNSQTGRVVTVKHVEQK
jgi:RHS repeat-associated protein